MRILVVSLRVAALAALSVLIAGCVVRSAIGAAADVAGAGVSVAGDAVETGADIATPDDEDENEKDEK